MSDLKEVKEQSDINRRNFLKGVMGSVGAAAAIAAFDMIADNPATVLAQDTEVTPNINRATALSSAENESLLERMRAEIERALAKPVAERRWVMVIDLQKCVGCHACTIACVAENHSPPGVVYRPVLEEEFGIYPNVARRFTPRPCMQCNEPPCVPVCPVNATYKSEDGVVVIDYDQCIGCRYCVTACPYGARTFDFGNFYTDGAPEAEGLMVGGATARQYESATNFEYDEARDREKDASPIGNVRKCHFCMHRVRNGMLPACVSTCIGTATFFGDANDPDSLVADLIGSPNIMRLKEELGTEPRVYYLT